MYTRIYNNINKGEIMDELYTVFVYGTLMSDSSFRANTLDKGKLVGVGSISGYKLYDIGYFPGAVPTGNPSDVITGELYLVDEDLFNALDSIEGYYPEDREASMYVPKVVDVQLDGKRELAVAYMYNQPIDGLDLIPSGSYRDHLSETTAHYNPTIS